MQGSKISPNYQRPSPASGEWWILDSHRAMSCRPCSDIIIPLCLLEHLHVDLIILDRIFPRKCHIIRSTPLKLESEPCSYLPGPFELEEGAYACAPIMRSPQN